MKWWLILFITLALPLNALAQTGVVQLKGYITDDQTSEYLAEASISCYLTKDSSRIAITTTNKNGEFKFENLPKENFYIIISFIGYKPISLSINLMQYKNSINVGTIKISKSGLTLAKIDVVGNKNPVRITKDTIEYSTRYFNIGKNDILEELLKRLPGIQVDKDGTIKINGENIKTILIDGKPFFSDDPKLVSKNLLAEMIDKIQVIDRKERERNPGTLNYLQTEKAINIVTNKNKQRKWIGQVMSGYGRNDRFAAKGNITQFKEKEQIAIFTGGDNINSYDDGMTSQASGTQEQWNYNINHSINLSNKVTINSNYKFAQKNNFNLRSSQQQNFINDSSYYYNQQLSDHDKTSTHYINSQITYKIDSSTSIIYSFMYNYYINKGSLSNNHMTYGSKMQLIDTGWIQNNSSNRRHTATNDIFFEKKIKNNGQLINVHISYSNHKTNNTLYNKSNTIYQLPDMSDKIEKIDQVNTTKITGSNFQLMSTYNEPLSTETRLSFSIGTSISNTPLRKSSFNYNDLTGNFDQSNDSLSTSFKSITTNTFGRIGIIRENKYFDYDISLLTLFTNLRSNNHATKEKTRLTNTFLLPRIFLKYKPTNNKQLTFSYITSSIQPSILQLQPIPDNSNPLIIIRGNARLKPGSDHKISLRYNFLNPNNFRYLSLGISSNIIFNKIINSIRIDSLNRQVSQPINVNGEYSLQLNMDNSFSFQQKSSIITNTSINMVKSMNSVGNTIGYNTSISMTQSASYNLSYNKIFTLIASANISCYRVYYRNQTSGTSTFLNSGLSITGNINLPLGIVIGNNISYSLNAGLNKSYNTSPLLINTYISKYILTKNKGLIKIQGFDLLNQNSNSTRFIGANYIEDSKSNTPQRFIMASFAYFIK